MRRLLLALATLAGVTTASHAIAAEVKVLTAGAFKQVLVAMVPDFEALGIRVLCNESKRIERGSDGIQVVGLDDVHHFYTPAARDALRAHRQGFRILLVHSNELGDEAAATGYRLYLCGHSHGGQICLPFGIPIFTHSHAPRRRARGPWRPKSSRSVGPPTAPVGSTPR